jgi:protein SCO1/2
LQPGDRIAFSLHVDDAQYAADDIRIVGHSEPASARAPARVNRVHEGDAVPEFAFVDERNRPLTTADLRGHLTVLTFVFTRCPVPEFCPLLSLRFGELQRAIGADSGFARRVRLLSITLDPEHDRPEVLTEYARGVGADPAVWSFATGETAQIDSVVRAFSVFRERNGVTLDHTLCTALVDGDGTIVELWRGNGWTTAEVLSAIRARISIAGP